MTRLAEERGFTIVEVMVAVVILLTGILGTLAVLDTATQRTRTADDRQKATSVAREIVEAAKGLPYRQVSPATIVERLRADTSIAGTSASPWRVERDGTPYTVQADVCWIDEPADELGSHAGGGFCTGSASGGSGDDTPIDFKRVTVTVSWENGSGEGSVRQSTLVSGTSGGGDAPAIQSVRMTNPVASPITSSALATAQFAVATVADAASVIWSVDGSQHGSASGSGRNWTFSWDLPEDGTYLVAAQTLESSGRMGEQGSVTVVVNRFLPAAPENFVAGRNDSLVEAEWSASRERDVVRYRVYRGSGGSPTLVCETTKTSCADTAAPTSLGGVLDYWVVAVERVSGVEREGTASPRVDVNNQNKPPHAPIALTLSKDAQGHTVLNWQAASVADNDAGDYIASYRIYRDGTALTDRLLTVGGTETTAVDDETGGATHQYWITAVDTHLAESDLLGPVSG
jgi:prepilin-type N-terminal cleavage/methylation domain-containing protein